MEFKVPQFLERETKVFSFFTFKQLALVGGVGVFLLILYHIVPRGLFLLLAVVIAGAVFSLLFVRIEGVPLGHLLGQFLGYFLGPKRYSWQKKEAVSPIKVRKKMPLKKEEELEGPLKISAGSRLEKLISKIDTGLK